MCEEEEDEILDEELTQSHTVLYENRVNTVKINENLQAHVLQLSQDKEIPEKEISTLIREVI